MTYVFVLLVIIIVCIVVIIYLCICSIHKRNDRSSSELAPFFHTVESSGLLAQDQIYEIPENNLQIGNIIVGEGEFGFVGKGYAKGKTGKVFYTEETRVAVKMLKPEADDQVIVFFRIKLHN